jgi:hypothetical protein
LSLQVADRGSHVVGHGSVVNAVAVGRRFEEDPSSPVIGRAGQADRSGIHHVATCGMSCIRDVRVPDKDQVRLTNPGLRRDTAESR